MNTASPPLVWNGAVARRASSWAWTPPARVRRAPADSYLTLLCLGLLGYAVAGRGFAYVGLPPLFVGEVLLGLGLVVLARSRSLGRVLGLAPMQILAALLLWVLVRTFPYLGTYGVAAVRDAMVVGYGLYAFIVAGLLVARPERLLGLLTRYRVLVVVMLAVGWAVFLAVRRNPDLFPMWPWAGAAGTRVVEAKAGDLLVHLAGITAFLVLGFRRATPFLLVLLLFGVGVTMVGTRGGMVGYLLAIGLFALMKPREARFGRLGYVGALLVALLFLVDTSSIRTYEGDRSFTIGQLWENARSVFGRSEEETLIGTTEWRKAWWGKIAGYTFAGPYFWQGKGFGINLASADGFRTDEEESLRSPHSAHMTMLARAGVPGLVLWVGLHAAWFGTLLGAWARARRAGQARWMGVFAFCAVYWSAALVNGSFDVYLEGPMGGIWFWTVFGVAMGAVWIHRRRPDLLADAPLPARPRLLWRRPAPRETAEPLA